MADDNTPTVTANKRKKTSKMRLRLDTLKRLQSLRSSKKGPKQKDSGKRIKRQLQGSNTNSEVPKPDADKPAVSTRPARVKKNSLAHPPQPKAKFRKRQIHKAWLPTHLFHAKRAHMTPPSQPLWRMAIPLSPTMKSYRPTHRASSSRGAMAWDTSYMSTIRLEGSEESILGLLQELALDRKAVEHNGIAFRKWLNGSRFAEGWLYEPNGWPQKSIALVTVVWQAIVKATDASITDTVKSTNKQLRVAIVRVQPSAFLALWKQLLVVAKARKPQVTLQDLRFEIGSIEMMGPASAEALVQVLRPSPLQNESEQHDEEMWDQLRTISNASTLPNKVVVSLNVQDPRLRPSAKANKASSYVESHQRLLQLLAYWPCDHAPPQTQLFDRSARLTACRQMPSQKAVNRRKAAIAPGSVLVAHATDPSIPVMILPGRAPGRGVQGSWTVLMPWKYVLPIWYCLMHEALSTGGTPKFGGLNERRQTLFEIGTPWFPCDFPGTAAGMEWERRETGIREADYGKRPKGKRTEFGKVDFGNGEKGEIGEGWACDWARLLQRSDAAEKESEKAAEKNELWQIPTSLALATLQNVNKAPIDLLKDGVVCIKLTMLQGGVPATCARIYRLPHSDAELRRRWLALLSRPSTTAPASKRDKGAYVMEDAPAHIRQRHLAASLLGGGEFDESSVQHPPVPKQVDLIGFVTTGNFNLGEGLGTGIGSILLSKACSSVLAHVALSARKERQLCIVRNVGHVTGRLARWDVAGLGL